MAHPKDVKKAKGKLWHKEDSNLTLVEARALSKHLRKTEEKRAKVVNDSLHSGRYEVWWATQ